jgi:hypothetical protein
MHAESDFEIKDGSSKVVLFGNISLVNLGFGDFAFDKKIVVPCFSKKFIFWCFSVCLHFNTYADHVTWVFGIIQTTF